VLPDGESRDFREFAMSPCVVGWGIVGFPRRSAVAPRLLWRTDDASPSRTPNGPGYGRRDMAVLRIDRSANGEVRFAITGRVEAAHVAELRRLIDAESAGDRPIVLDLKEVKLVDREAVSFFVRCEASGIRLENCPAYVREWIRHEVDETGKDD